MFGMHCIESFPWFPGSLITRHAIGGTVRLLIDFQVGPKNILILFVSSAMAEYSGVGALRYIGAIART